MNHSCLHRPVSMLLLGLCCAIGVAQERPARGARRSGPPHPEVTVDYSVLDQRIAWFGTMDRAREAAKKTGRAILLVSGAPSCQAVPGVW